MRARSASSTRALTTAPPRRSDSAIDLRLLGRCPRLRERPDDTACRPPAAAPANIATSHPAATIGPDARDGHNAETGENTNGAANRSAKNACAGSSGFLQGDLVIAAAIGNGRSRYWDGQAREFHADRYSTAVMATKSNSEPKVVVRNLEARRERFFQHGPIHSSAVIATATPPRRTVLLVWRLASGSAPRPGVVSTPYAALSNAIRLAFFWANCSSVHCRGALSGRQRSSRVP